MLLRRLACILTPCLCVSNFLYAANPVCPGTSCASVTVQTCITSPTGSCANPISPAIDYSSTWAGAWGGIITFPSFQSHGNLPPQQTYAVTFGTLYPASLSKSLYITSQDLSAHPTVDGYYTLKSTDGQNNLLPYAVQYEACDSSNPQNTQYITPGTGTSLPAAFPTSVTRMAEANPPCHPVGGTPGSGSGQLIFNIVNPQSTSFPAGTYQDSLQITVCSESTCT